MKSSRKQALAIQSGSRWQRGARSKEIVLHSRRGPTAKSVNRKVKKIQRREELKHKDILHSGVEMVSDPGTAQIILINPLAQGNTNITRNADRTTFTSIQTKGVIFTSNSNTDHTVWRVIIFRDMQSNGAAPIFTDLLDTSIITPPVHAPYNNDNTDRFRVISDKSGVITPPRNQVVNPATGTTTTVATAGHRYKMKWKLNFITNYGLGNAGTIADISKNSVYIMFLSDQNNASNFGPFFTGGTRMYFKDD